MKLLFKNLIILLLVPVFTATANPRFKGQHTKEKTIKKEFSVNPDATLLVQNSYGDVDITSWNENRTVIEVTIKANGNNESKVQDRLDEIEVDFTANASRVSAITRFGSSAGGSWKFWKKNSNISIEVSYTIKIPVGNSVDIGNDYGAIRLNRLEGNAKLSCDYGQLIIGELLAPNNLLTFDYTNNSEIKYMKSGKINADYSGFSLDESEELQLSADYTRSNLGKIGNLDYNCDYGKLSVDSVTNLVGRGNYIPNDIGVVSGSLNLNTDYGSINVNRLASGVSSVTVKSDYTGVKMAYEPSLSFDFIINLSYSSLKGKDDLSMSLSDSDGSKKSYSGYHGTKGSGATININSSYGGVSLTKL